MNNENNDNEDLNSRASLYLRAFNYINQHRPQLTRDLNDHTESHSGHAPSEKKRGTVTHPDQDKRLKENKDNIQQEKQEEHNHLDSNDSILEDKNKREHERKLEEIQRIEEKAKTASLDTEAGFTTKPQGQSSFVPKTPNTNLNPKVPKNIAETTPHIKDVPEGMSQEEAGLRAHPKHGETVRKLLGPQPANPEKMNKLYDKLHMASQEEQSLRNDPHYGVMASSILGESNITLDKLSLLRERLYKALQNADELHIKNAIQNGLSLTALLIVKLGFLKDAK